MRALLITSVKNEASFLLEWLAHHRTVGFTDILVFSNDCSDGTDLMLDRLQAMGLVTHVRNPGPHDRDGTHKGPQWAALHAADRHPLMKVADWVLFADVDEFVNIHVGDRRLPALLRALPDASAIALTWRLFGNDGVRAYEDRPVTEIFTRAAPRTLHWPWRAQLFKTLFRNDGSWRKLGVHRPRNPAPAASPRWFDGSGRDVTGFLAAQGIYTNYTQDNYQLVQLNHYPLQSMAAYLVKCDRGRANREAEPLDMSYWVERNFSDEQDRSIAALDSAAARAALLADAGLADAGLADAGLADAGLADAGLARLHRQAVAWRQARFAALMGDESWRALFGRLLMCPPARVLGGEDRAAILAHLPDAARRIRLSDA